MGNSLRPRGAGFQPARDFSPAGRGPAEAGPQTEVCPTGANLAVENLPRLCGVTVFRSEKLKQGAHRIRVVNKSSLPVTVDAFQVYGG
jgi:hypothetical protein